MSGLCIVSVYTHICESVYPYLATLPSMIASAKQCHEENMVCIVGCCQDPLMIYNEVPLERES